MDKGWSKEQQAFLQRYDDSTLDASLLIMPLVFFLSPNDPRLLKMLDTFLKPLDEGGLCVNRLIYRNNSPQAGSGYNGEEGTFNLCTFWMVEALTRAGKHDPQRLAQAELMFEVFLGLSNHLGLYAEELHPNGNALGNFPQAFTHLALISAAYNLDEVTVANHS
jgi:GH15 family glucan-1,4-alpha-glucosidase